ncbi:hypothetical protein E1A91_D02G101300v1 [Gossypium mustelinum]|uniref:Defective in cullin neddylation protein n=1 Tax=Gossypium mustelinum TaxID=34275 RepID=A0A5D2VTT2_GOSMU|nr:hypothetical protein E1A91_D02G101300v1 [Gossypium mustelinum]
MGQPNSTNPISCSPSDLFRTGPEEWRRGLKALRVDTVIRRPSNFVDFYSYSFCYCLTEEKQKSIDIESICQLLDLVLGSQFRAQIQSDYKVINLDQWMGFFRFCNKVHHSLSLLWNFLFCSPYLDALP